MKDIEHIISFKLPPKEAINYLKAKGYNLTFSYKEMMHEAHHKAFTVAKVTRLDLLSDIKEEILKAQKEGSSYQSFKKSIKPTLIKKGWWGDVEVINPKTGEFKNIFVGDKRLKTIFLTNMRVAYQVQKATKFYADDAVEYLRYISVLDNRTRPAHKALHGTILKKDDPFWKSHYPPNGWNCRCRVQAVPKHKIVTPTDKRTLPPKSVDADWDYDVRAGRYFDKIGDALCADGNNSKCKTYISPNQPSFKDYNLKSIKELTNLPKAPNLFKKAKTQKESYETLRAEILQDKKEIKVKTPITDIAIDENAIRHIAKNNREQFARFILPTLKTPNEVYRTKYSDKKSRYHFLKFFKIKKKTAFSVVRLNRDGGLFVTFFIPDSFRYIDQRRVGVLLYLSEAM